LIYKILEKTPTEATDYADLIRAIRKISSSVVIFLFPFFPAFRKFYLKAKISTTAHDHEKEHP
jgi:hypothetical protein